MPLTGMSTASSDQVPGPSEDAKLEGPVVQVADKETLQKRLESYYAGIKRLDLVQLYVDDYLSVAGKSMTARKLLVNVLSAQRAPYLEGETPHPVRNDKETFNLLCNFFTDEGEARQAEGVLLRIIKQQEDIWYDVTKGLLEQKARDGNPLRLVHPSKVPDHLKVKE